MLISRRFQMTDAIKEEMRQYRSLAVKVEENLRDKRLVKRIIRDKCVQAGIIGPVDKLRNINRYSSDSDVSSRDIASDTNNSDSYSKMTIVEPMPQVAGETRDDYDIQSSISDVQHSQHEVCLTNDTVNESKLIAAVTDQNKCIDVIETVTPNEDVTLPENWKPEVPRTLDIVPITLSNDEEDTSSSIGVSKETENPPKLSRQGSYVLDTPSPLLLAHMHTELTDENYTPTPTINVSQRKQWNITQSKVEWENEQFMAEDVEALSKSECTEKKSISEHREPDISTQSHQANKSISCTKAAVVEQDGYRSDDTPTKHNRRSSTDFKKQNSIEKLEKDSDTNVLNLSNKEYTGDVNSPKIQLSRIDEKQQHNKKENTAEYRESNIKTKSSTPDKLLMIYKEIEDMHKKQMIELIYRQRKEQSLLQEEFQKQQMLLLAEIQKCASGTPRRANSSNAVLNRSLSNDEARPASREARQQSNVNSPGNIHAETRNCNIKLPLANRVIVCPLDYFSSKNLYLLKHQPFTTDNSPATVDFDFTRKVSLCDSTYNNNNNNNNGNNDDNSSCESRDLIVYKNSNVSRQLFPLDSNTTHVPVLDNTAYLEKHVSTNCNFHIMIPNVFLLLRMRFFNYVIT